MAFPPTGIRAVLFDIYGTLLDGPRHADRQQRMEEVANRFGLPTDFRIDLAFDRAVATSHEESPHPHPEVDVREIWATIFPGLQDPDRFSLAMEEAVHPVSVLPEGELMFRQAIDSGLAVGFVTNAQAYTRILLQRHFPGLWNASRPDLMAFSYEHRISKPDLRLFRVPLKRLHEEGIRDHEVLMVGDSEENDIRPARRIGLRTHRI